MPALLHEEQFANPVATRARRQSEASPALRVWVLVTPFVAGALAVALYARPEFLGTPLASLGIDPIAQETPGVLFHAATALVGLLLPVLMATVPAAALAIVRERERRTLDALLLTALRPRAILAGKLVEVLLIPFCVAAALLPLLCLSLALGGVEIGNVAGAAAFLLLTHLLCASVAICISSWCRRDVVAMAGSYLALLLLFGVPFLTRPPIPATGDTIPGWRTMLLGLNPCVALLDIVTPATAALMGNPTISMAVAGGAAYALLIALCLALAVRGLRVRG